LSLRLASLALPLLASLASSIQAAPLVPPAKLGAPVVRNIVLVHGAWADGSSWSKVIPLLQTAGLRVTAVQNSLSTLAAANEDTRRAIAAQDGPTILVAHSWSGTVISDVGGDPKVKALVYVAARAPAAGEDFLALQGTFPNTPARAGVIADGSGFTTLSQSAFLNDFANGVPRREALVLYAVQGPTKASLFSERTSATAWKTKATYYAISKRDRTIDPGFERFLAQRMNAKSITVDAGHLSMVTRPNDIARLIIRAARGE
jgi:pimeloyl-ACP methyl ester carboxylesterase